MQNEITEKRELLDENGLITSEGFARHPYWEYRRERIKAPWWRTKEWDYYAIIDQEREAGFTITFSDLGYAGLFALCFVDIKSGLFKQVDTLKLLTRGRTGLQADIDVPHEVSFSDKKLSLRLVREEKERRLVFSADRIEGEVVLEQPPEVERMAIATSWAEKRSAFYYNQKINCMPARGRMKAEGEEFHFRPENSFGVLDWGRGHWTYRNRWYWASASGRIGGGVFGFNLGYGFSDRSPASENMLFFDGRAHKLQEVVFDFDREHLMEPWKVRSDDGRLDLVFQPSFDRASNFNLLLIKSVQDQVFGYYSGRAVLDDGTALKLDRLPGFIEDVYNRW